MTSKIECRVQSCILFSIHPLQPETVSIMQRTSFIFLKLNQSKGLRKKMNMMFTEHFDQRLYHMLSSRNILLFSTRCQPGCMLFVVISTGNREDGK